MPYWIINASKPSEECSPKEALEGHIRGGRQLLWAAERLFAQGGVVLDQFLFPYVDQVILNGGGCLKGIASLGDRMLVCVPDGLDDGFLGTETGLAVHIVEKRPTFSSFTRKFFCIPGSLEKECVTVFVRWRAEDLPDGWKDYELRRFCKRWQAFLEMAERQVRAEGARITLAEGQMLLIVVPDDRQEKECSIRKRLKEKISVIYRSQMDSIFPQGAPSLLWEEGVPDFRV